MNRGDAPSTAGSARAGCIGIIPLSARLEPWHQALCESPDALDQLVTRHGSPVNLIDPEPMGRNAAELQEVASGFGVDLRIFFARKSNKALCLVDEANRLGLGVDVAGDAELQQTLARGFPGADVIVTAAVKPIALLERAVGAGATIAIDNGDELDHLRRLMPPRATPVSVALRLAPDLGPGRPSTRFGLSHGEALSRVGHEWPATMRIDGAHFHLDGYDPADRVRAIGQALELIDALRAMGHAPRFIDMGGGVPVRYLDDADQWSTFWRGHRDALLGRRPPLTYDGHGLGLVAHEGRIIGRPDVYPFHQPLTRGPWLARILGERIAGRATIAETLRARGIQLRCEPGRALVDGCGLTVARVVHRKMGRDGSALIALEMNRTQCRTTSADFLVDPILVPGSGGGERTPPLEGYLVGAYCIERELLTWRRLRFPRGVAVGDLVVFPNTAGYFMHILESGSHQMPLARNLVMGRHGAERDPIDVQEGRIDS